MIAITNTASKSQAPRIAVCGISSRMHPAISPNPKTIRMNPGMCVRAKSCAALGITNSTASIKITTPSAHRSTAKPIFAFEELMNFLVELFFSTAFTWRSRLDLLQPVTGTGIQIQFVELLQLPNAFQRRSTERLFPVERVQHDAF